MLLRLTNLLYKTPLPPSLNFLDEDLTSGGSILILPQLGSPCLPSRSCSTHSKTLQTAKSAEDTRKSVVRSDHEGVFTIEMQNGCHQVLIKNKYELRSER